MAIAADTNSTDTVWFIQIVEGNRVGDRVLCDDYGHKIAAGANFLKGTSCKKKKNDLQLRLLNVVQRPHSFILKVFFILMSTSWKARRVLF